MENENVRTLREDIDQRQSILFDSLKSKAAIVVGLGGIGSWVAIDLALAGVGTLYIFDDDIIEASNLNRTLFRTSDIGRKKTDAVEDLIRERRSDTLVFKFDRKFTIEDYKKYTRVENNTLVSDPYAWIIDCSDTSNVKESIRDFCGNYTKRLRGYIKMGYNGYEGTISFNDVNCGMWGEDSHYTVVPSFFGTPQLLSALGVTMMINDHYNAPETWTFDMGTILYNYKIGQQVERSRGND